MTKEEKEKLLADAKERYPIGTVYIDPVYSNKSHKRVRKELRLFYKRGSDGIMITDGHGGSVYEDGKWAEIVSVPLEGCIVLLEEKIRLMEERIKS